MSLIEKSSISILPRASYNLVSIKMDTKGYSEVAWYHGKSGQKIAQWMHAKEMTRPDIFITVQEGVTPAEDRVVGIAVGVNYPSIAITKSFLDKL